MVHIKDIKSSNIGYVQTLFFPFLESFLLVDNGVCDRWNITIVSMRLGSSGQSFSRTPST